MEPLGFYPTPLTRLTGLEKHFKQNTLWMKRDDLTGFALGGNKARKLMYFFDEARKLGCDTIITAGAQQSNHCRQTAAGCAVFGLDCHLIVGGKEPSSKEGNLLLDYIFGATLHYAGEDRKGGQLQSLATRLSHEGRKCYIIPYGGSNALGARGFVDAVGELFLQIQALKVSMDYLFFASSSGGTQAGLMVGLEKYKLSIQLMPVRIDKEEAIPNYLQQQVYQIGKSCAQSMGISFPLEQEHIPLIKDFDLSGYGQLTGIERDNIQLLAQSDGILLDPVYTARAFTAMVDYLEKGLIPPGASVLFWHTGGIPALFSDSLLASSF